jgi:hypothetical protein
MPTSALKTRAKLRGLLCETLSHPEDHLRKAAAPSSQLDKGGELRRPSEATAFGVKMAQM